jgi:hypothetical protein
VASGAKTEISTNVVDLTSFPLGELWPGKLPAHVRPAVARALAYAGGPDATAIQSQNED